MKLVIISGRSGSGKSTALNLLEDEGYYCIDNLPVTLIPELVDYLQSSPSQEHEQVALCIDARNMTKDLANLDTLLNQADTQFDIVFLDADDDKLIKRFSETRRRHPLSNKYTALAEAINSEKIILEPIADRATLSINTSEMSLHELRSTIKSRLVEKQGSGISILFQSFGFKHGIPVDADFVYDIRILPNPHWEQVLRAMTGLEQGVIDFLESHDEVAEMFTDIRDFLQKWLPDFELNNRSYITVAIGCTGGQHRSVFMAEKLAGHFSGLYHNVQVRHREIHPITTD
jgi:RNase adapter protein RapZ